MNIIIWGSFRTGTNWMGDVCKMNFNTNVDPQLSGRKHLFLNEMFNHRGESIGTTLWRDIENRQYNDLHIVMYKNEQNWLHSMTRTRASKNGADFMYNVFGEHNEQQLLRHYRTYYNLWSEFDIPNKFILNYEEMLIEPEGVIEFISNKWDIPRKPFNMPVVGTTSQSKDLNNERIQMYINNYRGDIS